MRETRGRCRRIILCVHGQVVHGQVTCTPPSLFTRCAVQGDQLVVYGGERSAAAEPPDGAELGEGGEDDDEDSEPIADVCQLCLQSHYWVVLPMEGEKNSQLPARTGPSITAMPDGRGLVFGESSAHPSSDALVASEIHYKALQYHAWADLCMGEDRSPQLLARTSPDTFAMPRKILWSSLQQSMSSFSLMQSSVLMTLPMRHGLTGCEIACRRPGLLP